MWQVRILTDAVVERCQNAADGAAIDAAVRMAADTAINGTGIQTRPAADALQAFAKRRAEDFRAAVIENDEVKFLRAVQFTGSALASQNRRVDGKRLARRAAGEELQENGQILQAGDNLFHPHDGDMHARASRGEPAVTFVRYED